MDESGESRGAAGGRENPSDERPLDRAFREEIVMARFTAVASHMAELGVFFAAAAALAAGLLHLR